MTDELQARRGLNGPADLDGQDRESVIPPGAWVDYSDEDDPVLRHADGTMVDTWREDYPYDERMERPEYEHAKRLLQVELLKLQYWAQDCGRRLVVVFEGRDAAGKGSTIKRFMEHLNPRAARIVALDVPTDRERRQWYFQRYVTHLPAAGEIVLFDRSWYNRAGVEKVMGFCTQEEYEAFLRHAPRFEQLLEDGGISLTKFWFSVTPGEQRTRFAIRQIDPVRQWKLSPTDIALLDKWDAYTEAKVAMFRHTDTPEAPWTVVKSNDKKRARLEAMRSLLSRFEYDGKDHEVVGRPDPLLVGAPANLQEDGIEDQSPTPIATGSARAAART
jgi:polyphosphate kinase 2